MSLNLFDCLKSNIKQSTFFYIPTFLFLLFLSSTSYGQLKDSTVYAFLNLKDGNKAAGNIISIEAKTIILNDFTLGELHISRDQIVKEVDVSVGNSYCFTMKTGQQYCGDVVGSDSVLHLKTQSLGVIILKPREIKTVDNIAYGKSKVGELWIENPMPSKYFISPSAFTLKRRERIYQNTYLLINGMDYGLTDHTTIGAKIFMLSYIPTGFMVYSKTGTELIKNFNVSGGISAGATFLIAQTGYANAFGTLTFGNEENNISVSASYGVYKNDRSNSRDWEVMKYPVVSLSAMKRVSRNFALVTDNVLFSTKQSSYFYSGPPYYNYTPIYNYSENEAFSLGGRFFYRRSVFELGIFVFPQMNSTLVFPVLTIPFFDYALKF